jgi:hypothetical protein
MARIKQTRQIYYNDHVENDTGHYVNVRKWLSRISKVIATDKKDEKGKDKEWQLDGDCKLIYAYLSNWGKANGYHNIYPNYTLICDELGMNDRKLSRKLNTLCEIGLITIIKNKGKDGRFDSNQYKIHTPKTIANRKWYNINKEKLTGKLYWFDPSIFHKH